MFFSAVCQFIILIINYILVTISTLVILINFYLGLNYLRRQWGQRVKPDGRKAIIITGSTSGLGLVMAKHFHEMGFTIIATYYNKLEPGYKQLSEIGSIGKTQDGQDKDIGDEQDMLSKNHLFMIPLDVSSRESIDEAQSQIDKILDIHKLGLFCLINNAGIASDGPFQWINSASMVKVVETNLLGVMLLTRKFIFRIIKEKGRVVNISSGLHAIPCVTTSIYGSTKSAIAHFSDALHLDIRRYGASCRCVIPGNLMASTNIIFTRVRGARQAIDSLTEEERCFYDRSIRKSMAAFAMIARDANETNAMTSEDLEKIYGVSASQLNRHAKVGGFSLKLLRKVANFISGSVGYGADTKIERSYVTKSFDDAVRLVNCPSRVYTGNFIYTNYFGPLMDLLPYELVHAAIEFMIAKG